MVAAVAVALVGEVLLRRYTRWFTANLSRRSQGTVQARGCLAYLVSVTVGVALAPAVAQPLERLTTGTGRIAGLLAPALLLGCNRAVGMGIGSLLVSLIWQPNLAVMLWLAVPLLVVSVAAIGASGRTKQPIDSLDLWDGPTPWTVLLLITAGGAVAWAIWSWSGWTSAAVLPCVLTWAQ